MNKIKRLVFAVATLILLSSSQGAISGVLQRGPEGVLAEEAILCNFYPADPVNGFPQGYYQLIGPDAANPNDWASCDPNTGVTGSVCDGGDAQYCESGRTIWKHGGYWDGTACIYAFDDIGSCGETGVPSVSETTQNLNFSVLGSFEGGTYTNMCGSGTAGNVYSCLADCNPQTGICNGSNVARFVCDGRHAECGGSGAAPFREDWGTSMSVQSPHPGCDKTVQVDVFTKYCRGNNGQWICGGGDMSGYMVWYSGACPLTQPPYQPQLPAQPSVFVQQPPVFIPQPPVVSNPPVVVNPPAGAPEVEAAAVATSNSGSESNSAAVSSSNNTNTNNNNISITNNVSAPQVQEAPRIIEVAGQTIVKELPKTGLPALAFATAAFIPAGFGLKKFGRTKLTEDFTATYLWEQRQFKAGS